MSFTSPYLFVGAMFTGIPEMVGCAEDGETLRGDCAQMRVCVMHGRNNDKNCGTRLV